ncbi:MAG: hypothetical protein JF587_05955 [Catenulisporales bacterium]|nr:hypothetical protein [Catenulisporales bacterium]
MPPIAQRLREPAAFVLLAFGAIATLFHTITFLFGPGQNNNGFGGGPSFSDRAYVAAGGLVGLEIVVALVGAVWLAHLGTQLKNAKIITLAALVSIAVADLFGVVALFSAFGANGASGWDKTQNFFVTLAELAVAGIGSWLILGYFQQYSPARPPAGFGQPPQPQQQAPQQQPWGPPPQQAPQQQPAPQPQWGQPQPPQQQSQSQDSDSMMTQAIPTVPQAGQQQQQQPPQNEGGLPIGNWTAE